MIITRPERIEWDAERSEFGYFLCSDLHIGASVTDYGRLREDLKLAADRGDRILINGDVFDLVLPSDRKRFRPSVLADELLGRDDVQNAALDMAYRIFEPVVENIDMIGVGNHDTADEKHHHVDLVAMLVDRLNGRLQQLGSQHRISYGGFEGFVQYRFSRKDKSGKWGATRKLTIYYHHGAGGSSPVTRGLIDFNRKAVWVDSDMIWLGHKHNRLLDTTTLRARCPDSGDVPIFEPQLYIMTGSYLKSREPQTQAQIKEHGRRGHYGADAGYAPQSIGGTRVVYQIKNNSGLRAQGRATHALRVEVEVSS